MSKSLPQKGSSSDSNTKALAVPLKKELEKYSPDETKKIVLGLSGINGDLSENLKLLGENIFPKWHHGNEQEKNEVEKPLSEKITEVLLALETDTHVGLMEGFDVQYRGMARELSSQIIKEYKCTTHLEKMHVEIVVSTYIRFLNTSKWLNVQIGATTINDARLKYMTILSKLIDRSHRQYLTSLAMLQQLKAPAIQMSIKANTAFIAQNQQINAPQDSHEINESK